MKNIGEELKLYFKEQGISQDELANRLGVSQSYISSLFSNRTKFGKKQAQKWSELFNFSIDFLLSGSGELLQIPLQYDENSNITNNHTLSNNKQKDDYLDIIKSLTGQLAKSQQQIDKLITIIENKL